MNEEKSTLRQGVNQFIDALFEIFNGESMDEIVSKHHSDALDISKIHLPKFTPSLELTNVIKNTSMETRRDLKLSFPPSNFSKDDPLTLYYTQLYQAVAYYTALICSNEEVANIFIEEMQNRGVDANNIDDFLNSEWALGAKLAKLPQMAELTKSLNKFWRKNLLCGQIRLTPELLNRLKQTPEYKNVLEEVADVHIMIMQITHLLQLDIMPMIDFKLQRQIERIDWECSN